MSENLLQNPNFATGDGTGWHLAPGWAVGTAGLPTPGVGYDAVYTGPGSQAITNLAQIPVTPGTVVTASCWVVGENGASGWAVLRINFYRTDGSYIVSIPSASVPNNYVWVTRTVSSGAPNDPNIAYATIDFAVINSTAGGWRWFCTNFWASAATDTIAAPGLKYYLKLFTSQYQLSANLQSWQGVLMQPLRDVMTVMQQFNAAYDIDVAVGSQLDVIGQTLGVSRTLPFQPSYGVSPILDDVTYRLLLKATQANNTWDGHIESLYTIWQDLFPNGVLYVNDHQDMTCTITTNGQFTSIESDLINHGFIVPRPEGVLYNYGGGVGPGVALFGFDLNTSSVAGFDTGQWA